MHWYPLSVFLGLILFLVVIWVFKKKETTKSKTIRTTMILFLCAMVLNFSFSPRITMVLDHFPFYLEYKYVESFQVDDFTFVVSENAEGDERIEVYARFLWLYVNTSEKTHTAFFHLEGEVEDYTVIRILYVELRDGTVSGLIITEDTVPVVLSVDGTSTTFPSTVIPNIGLFTSGTRPGLSTEITYDGTPMVYWGTTPIFG